MDFFEAQERARGRTNRLLVLFVLAVAGIVACVYVAVLTGLNFQRQQAAGPAGPEGPDVPVVLWDPEVFGWCAAGVGLLVVGGALFKVAALARGGPAVAEMLGGKRVDAATRDPAERRLLNIVEEMSIAAGMPAPAVYVLAGEPGINAFAAGYSARDAAVAVTRGAMEKLSRDELQGVVAHEFSHVLNGDMRLNIRLIGIIFGILLLGVVGRGLLRVRPGRSSSGKGNGGVIVVWLAGLALWAIGSLGVLFGRMIQAAVSRQREFLADAAAVQFTRNPAGLAGALKKIGGLAKAGRVDSSHAPEAQHLFFASALGGGRGGLLASHPPLEERIRRLEPAFAGTFAPVAAGYVDAELAAVAGISAVSAGAMGGFERRARPAVARVAEAPVTAGGVQVVASIGAPTADHVARAQDLMDRLPLTVMEALTTAEGARVVVCSLFLHAESSARGPQRDAIVEVMGAEAAAAVERTRDSLEVFLPAASLSVLFLALPVLRGGTPDQTGPLLRLGRRLAEADQVMTLFEFCLLRVLEHHLGPPRHSSLLPGLQVQSYAALQPHIEAVLSALAWAGEANPAAAARTYRAALASIPFVRRDEEALPKAGGDFGRLGVALDRLRDASPPIKRNLLAAFSAAVVADGVHRSSEVELLRCIADAMDCPMPPLGG